jgi:AraC-like DNA-binding protein/quercetin dioxygenase-like cupin family protein
MATSAAPTPGEPDFFSRQTTQARRFWLDLAPAASARLVVTCGGEEHCGADYAIHRAGFRFYSVEFVAQGRGSVTLRRRTYPLVPGMVFAYGPGVSHVIRSDPSDTLVKFFVSFAGRDAARLMRRCGIPPGRVLQTRSPGDITAVFDDLIRNGLRKTPYSSEITALVTRLLLVKIAEAGTPPGVPDLASFATYRRCRQFMDEHWAGIARVHDVARACGIESAYLCRLFQRFDHQTPHRYLLSLRMREAAQQLARPAATVKGVASSLGFADPFHFSRTFKSVYGVSPRQFGQREHRD